MAVAIVGTTTSATNSSGLTLTITSHTVPTGSDRCLVVLVFQDNRNSQTLTGITWNGSENLTKLRSDEESVSFKGHTEIWYILAPTEATANVVVTWNGTSATKPKGAGALNFTGVHQTTPFTGTGVGNFGTTTGPATVTVPAETVDDMIVSVIANYKGTANAPTGNQTEQYENGVSGTEIGSGETGPGSTSATNLSTTLTGNSNVWAISAGSLLASAGVTTFDANFTVDAIVVDRFDANFTIDAYLQQETLETFTIDSVVVDRFNATFTIDASLFLQQSLNFTIDALAKADQSKLFLIDSYIQDTFSENFTIDGFIGAWMITGVTKDNTGATLGNCEVAVFKQDLATPAGYTYITKGTSDGSGNYNIQVSDGVAQYMVYSINISGGHAMDATDNVIQPVLT